MNRFYWAYRLIEHNSLHNHFTFPATKTMGGGGCYDYNHPSFSFALNVERNQTKWIPWEKEGFATNCTAAWPSTKEYLAIPNHQTCSKFPLQTNI